MNKNKVQINQKDLKTLQKRFDRLEDFDKFLDKALSVTVKKAENEAANRFTQQWNQPTGQGRASITSGKTKKLGHYVKAQKMYMAYLEWGTRRQFKPGNLRPMLELGIPKSYAAQFKASPLKKATNIPSRPYFFPSIQKAIKDMNKELKKQLDKITK